MFTMIFAEIRGSFKRIWRLYLTNIMSIMLIILLYAYIDGSRRQLNMQNTVFSGEIVVKMATNIDNTAGIISSKIPSLLYVSEKISGDVQYHVPGNSSGLANSARLTGVDISTDKNLASYLTLKEGSMIKTGRDILIPSSLLKKIDIKIGGIIQVSGYNAAKSMNSAAYRVCGIYNSPSLTLFDSPRLLITLPAMNSYYMPSSKDIEYCLFFRDGNIPDTINKDLREAFNDTNRVIIDSIEAKRVSSFDVLNLSVQFNVFMILMIILTIIVVVTVVILVNFNINLILFRKRQQEIGTLMAFGVRAWKIGLTLYLESVLELLISTAAAVILCFIISAAARQQMAGGFLEVLFVLLSGTNRIDFFIQGYQVMTAFIWILAAVTLSQAPVFLKVLTGNPIDIMAKK
jgi:ABC-type lipoprotein release transport system permease subunit